MGLGNHFQPTNVFHEMGQRVILNGARAGGMLIRTDDMVRPPITTSRDVFCALLMW